MDALVKTDAVEKRAFAVFEVFAALFEIRATPREVSMALS
jgi:hypothetical protein